MSQADRDENHRQEKSAGQDNRQGGHHTFRRQLWRETSIHLSPKDSLQQLLYDSLSKHKKLREDNTNKRQKQTVNREGKYKTSILANKKIFSPFLSQYGKNRQ